MNAIVNYQFVSQENKLHCDEFLKDKFIATSPEGSYKLVYVKFYHYGIDMMHTGKWHIKATLVYQNKHKFKRIVKTVIENISK